MFCNLFNDSLNLKPTKWTFKANTGIPGIIYESESYKANWHLQIVVLFSHMVFMFCKNSLLLTRWHLSSYVLDDCGFALFNVQKPQRVYLDKVKRSVFVFHIKEFPSSEVLQTKCPKKESIVS